MIDQMRPGAGAALCLAVTMFVTPGGPAMADVIDIRLEAPLSTYQPGDAVEVSVFATTSSLLVGYGFDLSAGVELDYLDFDTGPDFVGVPTTPDADRMAGLSFTGGVDGVDILLGIAHYLATGTGNVSIALTTTSGDLTEGFARFGSGFYDISTSPLELSIITAPATGGGGGGGGGSPPVPEPTTVLLLVSALWAMRGRRL